jgi:hypothetical protein
MLRQILLTCDASARGRRDRALLLFGFTGALRRSELVSLQVEDVAIVPGRLRLRIRRGKTDQAGQGAEIGLPRGKYAETCPVRAFEAWHVPPNKLQRTREGGDPAARPGRLRWTTGAIAGPWAGTPGRPWSAVAHRAARAARAALRQTPATTPLGQKGNWVVMAAWLLQLRSGLLLPTDAPAHSDAAAETDQLRDRMVELQHMQALAAWLDRRPQLGHDVFACGKPEVTDLPVEPRPDLDIIEFLWASLALFDDGDPALDAGAVYRPRPLALCRRRRPHAHPAAAGGDRGWGFARTAAAGRLGSGRRSVAADPATALSLVQHLCRQSGTGQKAAWWWRRRGYFSRSISPGRKLREDPGELQFCRLHNGLVRARDRVPLGC